MLKIHNDKVIIDGHELTKERCETMTLLVNALQQSKDFRQVEYRNGYAKFEKIGKTNNLKFAAGTSSFSILTADGEEVCYISSDSTCTLSYTDKMLTITGAASVYRSNSSYIDSFVNGSDIVTLTMKQNIISLSAMETTGDNITITFNGGGRWR